MKVDTKKYGLPQTRNRKYMFAWRPDVAPLQGVAPGYGTHTAS